MKKIFVLLTCLILITSITADSLVAQSDYQVHSHNDYKQNIPFWFAYSNGASSIEVDLYLRNDTLYVTHAVNEIKKQHTFENLYLQPILGLVSSGNLMPLQLLIDIKSEAYATLDKIVSEINKSAYLADNDRIKFVISGNRPKPKDYINYPAFIHFDHQNLDDLDELELSKVAMISQSFRTYSLWNGYGRMTAKDSANVELVISKGKSVGIPFRFWATPDTKTAWANFAKLGVGYINTDKPALAKVFLDKLDFNTHIQKKQIEVYVPEYSFDINQSPENVILMVGDGNGLAQISAALIANKGKLSMANIQNIGLINTSSADDLNTDSAAGGSAFATGVKTDNRAIGVNARGEALENIMDILTSKGYHTAIITTDAIYGATPSAFYANTIERDDTESIIKDLNNSNLNFFISAGQRWESTLKARYKATTLEEFNDFLVPKAIYNGWDKMPSIADGRNNFLPNSISKALEVLNDASEPFFLLVEGAQIDNGGHANSVATIIEEMLDFDLAVGEAMKFVDKHNNTLLVVTADHETGGLGIAGGDLGKGMVRADFLSVDHTGILVPVFSYGPQSHLFRGFYDNTAIFHKILKAVNAK